MSESELLETLCLRLNKGLIKDLKAQAKKEDRTTTGLIRHALKKYLAD